MKTLALIGLLLVAPAALAAPFTPAQLAQLVKKPASFKPTEKSSSQVNANTPVTSWRWGAVLTPSITLRRMNGTPNWSLKLSGDVHKVTTLAPGRKTLFTVADPTLNTVVTGSSVISGPLKGSFLLETRYRDGSGGIELLDKGFAVRAGLGSDFGDQSESKMYSYPFYGYFEEQPFFCGVSRVACQ